MRDSPSRYTTKEFQMQQFNSYLKAVEQHIESGFNLGDAMAKFLPVFNTAKPTQQLEMRSAVARLISIKKKVATIEINKGAFAGSQGFQAKHKGGTDATERARVMLKYYMPQSNKVEKTSTKPKAKPSPVAKLLTQFKSLTPAQRKAFLSEVL